MRSAAPHPLSVTGGFGNDVVLGQDGDDPLAGGPATASSTAGRATTPWRASCRRGRRPDLDRIARALGAAAGVPDPGIVHVPSDAIAAEHPDWGAALLLLHRSAEHRFRAARAARGTHR